MSKKKTKKRQTKLTDDFKFLSDKALDHKDELNIRFGHERVAKALLNIIKRATPPFTIGLYGSWGSGKTTIVNLLKDGLSKKKVKTVYFDVWKFQKDSLRRQFLLESAKQLGQKRKYNKLKKAFYIEVSENEEVFSLKWKSAVLKASPYIFELLALTVIFLVIVYNYGIEKWKEILLLTLGGITGIKKFIEVFAKNLLVVDKKVLKANTLAEPERFVEEFQKILSSSRQKKIIFVFDNLDRTYDKKAIELLTTIKTFLGEDRCIFLIPCDEDAIRRHVASGYLGKDGVAEEEEKHAVEFLRKFFDTTLRIPKFEDLDLDEYTEELLAETNVDILPNDPDLIRLITYAFRDNPREIKQFINTLISALVLIRDRLSDDAVFEKNVLKSDVAFVAKMLIFRQRCPKTYSELENLVLKHANSWEDIESVFSEADEDGASKFISETDYISPYGSDLTFYLTFIASKEEEKLPGWTQFLKSSLDRNVATASKFLKTFNKEVKLKDFDSISSNYLKKHKDHLPKTRPFVSTCIGVFYRELKTPITEQLAREIVTQIRGKLLTTDSVDDFPIEDTIKALKPSVGESHNKMLADQYVRLLGTVKEDNTPAIGTENAIGLFKHIALDPDYFDKNKKKITGYLAGNYCRRGYLEIFAKPNLRRKFINSKVVAKYIDLIGEQIIDSLEILKPELSLVKELRKLDEEQIKLLVRKLETLIRKEDSLGDYERDQKTVLVEFLNWFLEKYSEVLKTISTDEIEAQKNSITDTMINWFNHIPSWGKRTLLFKLSVRLREVVDDTHKVNLEDSVIKTYAREANHAEGYSSLDSKEVKLIVNSFGDEFVQAANRESSILSLGKKFLNDNQRIQLISLMLDSSKFDDVISFIESLGEYVIETDQVITLLFNKLASMNQNQKGRVFGIAYKLKCANKAAIVERFFNELKSVKETDKGKKWIGKYTRGKLFSPAQKTELKTE